VDELLDGILMTDWSQFMTIIGSVYLDGRWKSSKIILERKKETKRSLM
jgi:hypothetical protein